MNEPLPARSQVGIADAAGLSASVVCAIHCAAMPLVVGYLPMLGLSWLADPAFHRVAAVVCFVLALSAFFPGWKRHGSLAPTLLGSLGVGLLSVAAFGMEGECCPSCAVEASPPPVAAACSDPVCTHCTVAAAAPEPEPTAVSASAPLGWAVQLVTPLGGVFLVAGHLSNHRRSCSCCGEACDRRAPGPVEEA